MKAPITIAALLLLLQGAQTDAQKDLVRFQGTWATIYVEIDGKEVKEDIKQDRLTVTGDKFTFTSAKSKVVGSLKIDATKKPPTIDEEASVGDKTIKTVGIYEINDKRLMVCYSVSPAPRPTDFSTSEKSGRYLIVYQRVGPEK